MLSIRSELRALVETLEDREIRYALCGALALSIFGYPRSTLDIDLVSFAGNAEAILTVGRELGFTLPALPMSFAKDTVRINRLTKVDPEDVISLDVLTLAEAIEKEVETEERDWNGLRLVTVRRESLILLKRLRSSTQDLADIEKLS